MFFFYEVVQNAWSSITSSFFFFLMVKQKDYKLQVGSPSKLMISAYGNKNEKCKDEDSDGKRRANVNLSLCFL